MNQDQLNAINKKIAHHGRQRLCWQLVVETCEQENDPYRDLMVVKVCDKYVATSRWEINPDNGYLTVQLVDGNVLPTRLGNWCPFSCATDFFEIERERLELDNAPLAESTTDT